MRALGRRSPQAAQKASPIPAPQLGQVSTCSISFRSLRRVVKGGAVYPSSHMSEQITIPSDIEIAQAAKLRHISDVAAEIGLGVDDLDLYGKYKAKIPLEISKR